MKKNIFLILLTMSFFFILPLNVHADIKKARIDYSDVRLRKGPGTNYDEIKKLSVNSSYELADVNIIPNEKGCSDGWYKIYYNGNTTDIGYVCSTYVVIETFIEAHDVATTDCEKELQAKGFPQSYWTGLCNLKNKYPSWNFLADVNGLEFSTAVSKEAVGKKSLIQTSNEGYLSTSSDAYNFLTDTFTVKEGSNWYSASSEVVAYYMDPRNFLDEKYVFMFEKLSFDESYQTIDAVRSVLNGRDINSEAQTIYNAAREFNVNAIYLASRIRQETGGNYSNYSLAGHGVTVNGTTYAHIYNPYNIGAYTGAGDGLVWAATGTKYLRPWTNIPIAIRGGASFLASSYIAEGQDTGYFQKFNTGTYSSSSTYSHQYMSNIKAAYSEAGITYNGYKDMDILNNSYTFVIPVYNNMASSYNLPNPGNPNNHLKALNINNTLIKNFAHDTFEYTYYVPSGLNQIVISASTINSKATVIGEGKINLPDQENNITINVTAQNGKVQPYVIKVIKTDGMDMAVKDILENTEIATSDNYMILPIGSSVSSITSQIQKVSASASVSIQGKTSGNLATGDVITITNGKDTLSYNITVKGDPTGDGNINIQDLLRIQKYILGYTDLSGSFLKAGDTNNDGIVDIVDLLRVQKHILGYVTIK